MFSAFFQCKAQKDEFIAAQKMAAADILNFQCTYLPNRNVYVSRGDVIHIFMFEDGNLLLAGYPSTATEKSKYVLHLYVSVSNDDLYLLEYTGSFSPVLGIQNSNSALIGAGTPAPKVQRVDFAVLGPFTNNLIMTLKRSPKLAINYNTLTSTTIQISKTIHASIGTGLIYTTLKNPSNLRSLTLPNGNNTLIADDNKGRGMLTVLATYYPWGRNSLLLPSWGFKDRFGVIVGTSLAAGVSNFSNAYLGGQYDFSIGGSIIAGFHYGKRQKISGVDYKTFSFGETEFTGNLDSKKYTAWDGGLFVGVQVDSRIFTQLFK